MAVIGIHLIFLDFGFGRGRRMGFPFSTLWVKGKDSYVIVLNSYFCNYAFLLCSIPGRRCEPYGRSIWPPSLNKPQAPQKGLPMKLSFRPWKGPGKPEIVFNKKLGPKNFYQKLPSFPKKGMHVRKTGRIVDIQFHCSIEFIGNYNYFLSLTESEVFQLAKLCLRGRTDEELLKAIRIA